jgi:ornithine cyclodeaminase
MRAEGYDVVVEESAESCVKACDVLITVTASEAPLVRADWLRAGQHVSAVGADFPGKQELEAAIFAKADRIVCDRLSQCLANGELQHVAVDGALPAGLEVAELGQLTVGAKRGREKDDEITVCDLTGTGVQDTAIANVAYAAATKRGFGIIV